MQFEETASGKTAWEALTVTYERIGTVGKVDPPQGAHALHFEMTKLLAKPPV